MTTSKPLTAALRRNYANARTCLARAAAFHDPRYYAKAAGHLLAVCKITGETSGRVLRRLKINPLHKDAMRRHRSKAALALAEINRPAYGCVRGDRRTPGGQCTCSSLEQRDKCGNWRRDPSSRDIGTTDGLDDALAVVQDIE